MQYHYYSYCVGDIVHARTGSFTLFCFTRRKRFHAELKSRIFLAGPLPALFGRDSLAEEVCRLAPR